MVRTLDRTVAKKLVGDAHDDCVDVTRGRYHSMQVCKDGKIRLTLGNMSDASWYWHGEGDEILGFLERMHTANDKDTRNAIKEIDEGVDYADLKSVLLTAAKKKDGLYEVSGDNRVWNFGEFSDESEQLEEHFRDNGLSKDDISSVMEEYWVQKTKDSSYDAFEKKQGKNWVREAESCVNRSRSVQELAGCIKEKGEDFKEAAAEFLNEPDWKAAGRAMIKLKVKNL